MLFLRQLDRILSFPYINLLTYQHLRRVADEATTYNLILTILRLRYCDDKNKPNKDNSKNMNSE